MMSPEPAPQFAKQHRPQTSLVSSSRDLLKEGQVHRDEICFELCISLRFGREAEIFRVSLGIRKKKKIRYFHCANRIFPLLAEASCKVHH